MAESWWQAALETAAVMHEVAVSGESRRKEGGTRATRDDRRDRRRSVGGSVITSFTVQFNEF